MNIGNKKNPKCNNEGYTDLTAYEALQPLIKADAILEHRVKFLVKVLRYIASEAGFDLIHRIELRDRKTGRVFR